MKVGGRVERSYTAVTNQGSASLSLPTNQGALLVRLSSSLRRLPLSQPISRRLLQSVRGAHAPRAVRPRPGPRPPDRGPAPSREGVESVTCSGGGGGPAPLGSCVLRLPAPDCPLRRPQSLPSCLRGQGFRGRSERSSRGPRLLRAGNGAPEPQRRWEHGVRCGRWALLPLQLPPAVAGPSHQEPPTRLEASRSRSPRQWRHLAERWGRGRARSSCGRDPLGTSQDSG